MLAEYFSTLQAIVSWTAAIFCWCMFGYSVYSYRRSNRRSSAEWERMFTDLRKDQDDALRQLSEALELRRHNEENAWKLIQLRMYLLSEMERRNIPLPKGFEDDTTVH